MGPASLLKIPLSFVHEHVIRRKDMLGMFDTTLDLAGHDLDISRFIRRSLIRMLRYSGGISLARLPVKTSQIIIGTSYVQFD